MRYDTGVGRNIALSSGRVIALGRLLLALLFLLLTWIDAYKIPGYPNSHFALFGVYSIFAASIVAVTWNNWWLEARLAGAAHTIDIALFAILVYLTHGDNNPFFTFSIFIFLSAALRWGWRSTALTAVLLSLLFLLAASFHVSQQIKFRFTDYMAGAGQLFVLSLIVIWFGVNQWRSEQQDPREDRLADPSKIAALENGLRSAMARAGASSGALVWTSLRKPAPTALVMNDGELSVTELPGASISRVGQDVFLYDAPRDRSLRRDAHDNLRPAKLSGHSLDTIAAGIPLREGLSVPVFSERGEGRMYLENVRGLSIDHLRLGSALASEVATKVERRALMKAAEESAESRSRLAMARDLHDSVVQFLAGAAFRLEALKRSEASGRNLVPELNELKELMLQEQGELRSFIAALRGGAQTDLVELAKDLQALAKRLARQWDIQCTFSADAADFPVAARLHLDAQQLVREAVANAVRHAGAKNVSIRLAGQANEVKLDLINDGSAYPRTEGGQSMPKSLKERVEAAGGAIDLSRGMGVTRVSISLPAAGRAA